MINKKTILAIFIAINAALLPATAQLQDELQQMQNNASSTSVKPEALDRMVNRLRDVQTNNDREEQLLMDTHKAISNGYAINNHFKPAYREFAVYLDLKEKQTEKKFSTVVNEAKHRIDEKAGKLDSEVDATRKAADELKNSAARYTNARFVYKKFFSAAIIVLSVLFGFSLFRSGLRLLNMRSETTEKRIKIVEMHRIALIGKLVAGNESGISAMINDQQLVTTDLLKRLELLKQSSTVSTDQKTLEALQRLSAALKRIAS